MDCVVDAHPEVASRSLSLGILRVRRWAVEEGRTVALVDLDLETEPGVGAGGRRERDAGVGGMEVLGLVWRDMTVRTLRERDEVLVGTGVEAADSEAADSNS